MNKLNGVVVDDEGKVVGKGVVAEPKRLSLMRTGELHSGCGSLAVGSLGLFHKDGDDGGMCYKIKKNPSKKLYLSLKV